MKVAIIGGSGKMGQWFANLLLKDGKEVIITGRNQQKLLAAGQELGTETNSNTEATTKADVIIVSVPLNNFEAVVKEIGPHTRPEQIILDVTSIKTSPVEVMHRYIKNGTVLGTHPVFGPGAKDVANQNFVLTPTNDKEQILAQKLTKYLETRGGRVSLMTPKEHDEMMAIILGLSHFIALVSADTLLTSKNIDKAKRISGTTYKVLMTLIESVVAEDSTLYSSLQMNLPNVTSIESLFHEKAKMWAELVANKDSQQFIERMDSLRDKLKEIDPAFGRAYENMYKLTDEL